MGDDSRDPGRLPPQLGVPRIGDLLGSAARLRDRRRLWHVPCCSLVHSRMANLTLMPWIVASQRCRLWRLHLWSSWSWLARFRRPGAESDHRRLSLFFPVVIGVAKGLASPDALQRDLMRTWAATPAQVLIYLRTPVAVSYLRQPESSIRSRTRGDHRRRIAGRRAGRDWGAAPRRLLLRSDDPDPLLQRQADCISTMTYNEYWQIIDGGIPRRQAHRLQIRG
jgi:hypothetical protein